MLVVLIVLVKLILRDRLQIRWHYWLWVLLLIRLVTPWVPKTRLSIFNIVPHTFQVQQTTPALQSATLRERRVGARAKAPATARREPPAVTSEPREANVPKAVTTPKAIPQPQAPPKPAPAEIVAHEPEKPGATLFVRLWNALPFVWLTGAVGLGGLILVRNFSLWRMVKRERPITDSQILELLEDCKMQMGIQTIVGVVVTDRVKGPALFGFVRPRLLLPEGLIEDLGLDELYYVFIHELCHLKRRDVYLGWLISLLQVLHWFNPLMWFAFHRMRLDREFACDALAVSTMNAEETPVYGRTILNLLERFSQVSYMPSIAGILEDSSQIERRIKMIAEFRKTSRTQSVVAVVLMAALCCVGLTDAYSADPGAAAVDDMVWLQIGAAGYGGGAGTAADPYQIYTAEQMNEIGANPTDWGKHFKLMEDIDLSVYTGEQFNIIGVDIDHFFSGVFDGSGQRIYNFSYTSLGEKNVAIFGFVRGGTIKNLGLVDSTVEAAAALDVRSAASLVGQLWEATITNCHVESCSVSGAGNRDVGGLVGSVGISATITDCCVTGTVSGDDEVGGLVGYCVGPLDGAVLCGSECLR